MEEIRQIIDQINSNHGTEDWTPIHTYLENNYTQAIAGMKLYDVLLVNSVIDGMNLVAKEGPVVNTRDGVLVLSVGAGAHRQLSIGALSVSPADIEGTMQAMYQALIMDAEERARRANCLRETVEQQDNLHWLESQLQDIETLLLQGSA
jgi:trehalose 6-phosphate synthase